jgi:phage terminase large subunit-like protein
MGRAAAALTTPAWSFACPDWADRLKAGRSLVPDLPIDRTEGDRAVAIFNRLRLPDVPGQPAMEEAAGDWFRDIVRTAFGSLDAAGARHVAEIFALVPKKNSKTTGGAAVMITALLMNQRPNAELLFVGPTQEIAQLAYDQASGMIEADPDGYLQKRFLVRDHVKTIEDRLTGAELKVKTFDMKVMTGVKPVVVLVDELHIMSAYSYASRVIGQIRGGLLPNPESLLIFITTQSDQPPAGVFKQELQYARGVRDGRITDQVRMLPILYEFPEAMQVAPDKPWMNPATWPMVLPNLGRSITVERLIADFKQASEKGDEEIRRWASQHLNVEIGLALHADRWRGADYWEHAADATLVSLEALIARCDVVVAGGDGGGLDDLFGLAVLGRDRDTDEWLLWVRAWAQTDVFDRRKDIAERLNDFVAAGDLVVCTTPTQDIEEAADIIEQLLEAGVLPEKNAVGLDPAGIAAFVDELTGRGLNEGQIVAVPQGYRLSGAIWGAERKLKDGTLRHAGQGLMAWCVGNAKAEQRGNAVLITKETAGKAKIDPLMAAFNAVQLMARSPESPRLVTGADILVVV